jgi:hypothetical protein
LPPPPPPPPPPFSVGGLTLECGDGWRGQGGGTWSCFFEPISSCSLADATFEEVAQLGADGFRDDARLRIAESARRGVSAYHVPDASSLPQWAAVFGASSAADDARGKRGAGAGAASPSAASPATAAANTRGAHEWAAALAAFLFRLRPSLQAALEARRLATWPVQAGGTAPCLCGGAPALASEADVAAARRAAQVPGAVWGVHVRHGDVSSLIDVYGNRKAYNFSDFFRLLRARAAQAEKGAAERARAAEAKAEAEAVAVAEGGGGGANADATGVFGSLRRALGLAPSAGPASAPASVPAAAAVASVDALLAPPSATAASSASAARVLTPPVAVYVTSDDPDTARHVRGACAAWAKDRATAAAAAAAASSSSSSSAAVAVSGSICRISNCKNYTFLFCDRF